MNESLTYLKISTKTTIPKATKFVTDPINEERERLK
jgi:hypothetical protein